MKRDNADKNYRTRIARVVAALVADPMAVHSLEKLAGIAHFSPFHFHRLYRSLVGETIGDTIRRLRLAQAATLLGENRSSVTEIALACGYESPQAFTRAFRHYSGNSPREFQKKIDRIGGHNRPVDDEQQPISSRVKLLHKDAIRIQALQHYGPAATIPHTHRHLRQLVQDRPVEQWFGICYGDSELDGNFTYFAGTILREDTRIGGAVSFIDIPAGWYAAYTLRGPYAQINASISALYSSWLPTSGYEPDDRPLLELYQNNPKTVPQDALHTDLLIPIRPNFSGK